MPSASLRHVLDEMASHVRALRAHEAGARAGRDPEHLHEMRVAVRRLRAILRASRALFDARWVERLREELDWLGGGLGLVCDLDVLHAYLRPRLAALEGVERRPGQRVLRRLSADRVQAQADLEAALDGPRYPRILEQLETFLARPPASSSDISLPDVAATEWKRLRKAVQKLPGHPSADDLHAVRIKVKRARYAAELARAAAGERGKRFIRQAKKLQDILGDLQDAVVIEQYLHDAIDRTQPAQALGRDLVKRQRKRRKKARAAFFEEWPKLERRGREAWIARRALVKLLLIRHAPAVRNGSAGIRDGERPLTPRGRARFRLAARGLARIADRPGVLLTSPLVRARATAEIAAAAFKKVIPRVEPALGRQNVDAVVAALKKCPRDAMVAVVGHEPTLSRLLARMLGVHQDDDRFAFKKGGAALLDLPDGPAAGGQLRWFVKPRILRSLGGD